MDPKVVTDVDDADLARQFQKAEDELREVDGDGDDDDGDDSEDED